MCVCGFTYPGTVRHSRDSTSRGARLARQECPIPRSDSTRVNRFQSSPCCRCCSVDFYASGQSVPPVTVPIGGKKEK